MLKLYSFFELWDWKYAHLASFHTELRLANIFNDDRTQSSFMRFITELYE